MKELQPNSLVDGRYLVERKIGVGGMAAVYRVRHRTLGTPMALKLLTIANASVAARLLQEGKVQAALRHPNVVSVVDQIEVEGAVGLVMEFVRGPSLADLLDRMRLDPDQIDDLARGLFDGVEAAHLAGVVHRDLKPANVLVELAPGRLIPKIADFGLVKLLDPGDVTEVRGRTRTGTTFGTPEYMAPEQISDVKGVDVRADVWSVGVLLYEMLAGRKPFEHEDLLELFNRIAKNQRLRLDELAPDAPRRMIRAVEAALVPDRTRRVPDIAALRAIWSEGVPFPAPAPWSDQAIAQIQALSKAESTAAILDASLGEDGRATMVPPSRPGPSVPSEASEPWSVTPSVAPEEPPQRRQLWLGVGLLVAGSTALLAAGVVGLWAGFALLTVGEVVQTAPEAVVAAPDPAPDPAAPLPVAAPTPVAAASPVAPGSPVPVAPPPAPAPVDDGVAGIVFAPPPPPEPVPAVPAVPAAEPVVPPVVRVESAEPITVSLVDPHGVPHDLGDAAVGDYRVVAFFEPGQPSEVQAVSLRSGGRYVVRCIPSRKKCTVVES